MHMLVNYHSARSYVFGDITFDAVMDHDGVFAVVTDHMSVPYEMLSVEKIPGSHPLYKVQFFIQKFQRVLIEPYNAEGVICSYIVDPGIEKVVGDIHGSINRLYTLFPLKTNAVGRVRQICSEKIIKVGKTAVMVLPFYNDMTCKYEIMLSADDAVHQYHKHHIQTFLKNKYREPQQEYIIAYEIIDGRLETTLHYRPLSLGLSMSSDDEERLIDFVEGVLKIPEGEVCCE